MLESGIGKVIDCLVPRSCKSVSKGAGIKSDLIGRESVVSLRHGQKCIS